MLKRSKIIIVILIIFITLIILSLCAASDIDNTVYKNKDNKMNVTESECCSFVIQEEANESIFAFRQDSPVTPDSAGLRIETQDWQGHSLLKQRVDAEDRYFTNAMVLDNGWTISQGGSQYNSANKKIENITLNMVDNNEISNSSLEEIRQILIPYGYGHVLIKAPDGRYGIVLVEQTYTGILEPGEYLTVPNEIQYLDRGNYKDYGDDPVQAIIEICSWDESGENLRDQMIYHCKPHQTEENLSYSVDFYVTNCNGINIGLNKSDCVVPFYYKGVYYPTSVIPEYPEKLFVGTHTF